MRIAFFTDLHFGATGTGFCQQPIFAAGIPRLLERFREAVVSERIDTILIGGDSIDHGSPEAIDRFFPWLAALPADVLLCLGNHDLGDPIAFAHWQAVVRGHPHIHLADAQMATPAVDLCALNTHWLNSSSEAQLHWPLGTNPVAAFAPEQLTRLDTWLSRHSDRPAIVAFHAPLDPLPAALTGLPGPIHDSPTAYTDAITAILAAHPRVKLVLTGHCHATCATRHGGYTHLSLAALSEVPCQYAIIDATVNGIRVELRRLPVLADAPAFDHAKAWVVGRDSDRALNLP